MRLTSLLAALHVSRRRRPRSIRAHLVTVVLWTLLPLLALTAIVVAVNARSQRQVAQEHLVETAQVLGLAVDRELRAAEAALRALAASPAFDRGDLQALYDRALEIAALHGGVVMLVDQAGRTVLSTASPLGAAMSRSAHPGMVDAVFRSGTSQISDLVIDPVAHRPAIVVGVPITRGKSISHQLHVIIPPDRFAELLAGQRLVPGRVLSLLDRNGTVIAQAPARASIGGAPPPKFLTRVSQGDLGPPPALSLAHGSHVVSRSPHSGWTMALRMPASETYEGIWRPLLLVLGAAALTFFIGLGVADVLGGRLAAPLTGLATAAHLRRAGVDVRDGPSGVAEVEDLRRALDDVDHDNITERQQIERERARLLEIAQSARAEAESASRLRDEFIATLSHELRTPLHAITGWLALLRSGLDPAQQQHALDVIERNVQAQTLLVRDLFDVSRIGHDALGLEMRWTDLSPVVRNGCEALRPSAEVKGVFLQFTGASAGRALIDSQRIQQVIWNLVTNALRFTPPGGRIDVTLDRHAASWFRITVKDTGRGIPRPMLPHLFERFRRDESEITHTGRGLGLGLVIVKRLVERHGGTVRADSDGPGTGATFTVDLPAGEPPVDPKSSAGERDVTADGPGGDVRGMSAALEARL